MAKIYNDFQSANLMSFAKSFARLNGQPLDKSEIWYSLADAQAYAATDAAYVGQILAVIDSENNKVDFYGIQNASGELTSVGSGNVDEICELIEELESKIGSEANDNQEATGLYKLIADVLTEVGTKASMADVYTKDETNTAILTAVADVDHLKRKIVDSLSDIDVDAIDAHLYIYMVPTGLQLEDDKYDEYIVINGAVEKVGSWEVDLSNYATKAELDGKVNKDDNARLLTLEEGEKLASIEAGAQVNLFDELSKDFELNNRVLTLKDLPVSKIVNLQQLLDSKVNVQEGYTLLSPDDQTKLAALVIGEDNNLAISGKVNADNVEGLDEWLIKNSSTQKGLSENNLTDELYEKLYEGLLIKSIDTNQLVLSETGRLSVAEIDISQVIGFEAALAEKADISIVNTLQAKLDDIETSITQYSNDITEIKEILTWKDI